MIKKYLPYIAIVLLLIIICWQQNCINNAVDDKLAEIEKAKVEKKEADKQKAIAAKFEAANKPLIAENIKLKKELISVGINAGIVYEESEKRRLALLKIKDCPQRADGLNLALIDCNKFTLALKQQYSEGISALNLSCEKMIKSKEAEISALNASWSDVTVKLGDCTKELVIAKQKAKRITNLGFFAGIGIDGKPTAGFGITVSIIKLPKLFGGIL